MTLSNYAELKVLDHLTGRNAWTAPINVYLQLHVSDPGEDGTTGIAINTVRQLVTFSAATSGSITSNVAAVWTNVPAVETYTHWSLWNTTTSGDCLWIGALTAGAAVAAGDTFQITSLTLSIN